MHACFIYETSPTALNMQPFTRFWRKLNALSLLLEIFRSLNAIYITFYLPNVVHVVFSVETSTAARKSQLLTWFWQKVFVISLLLETFRRLKGLFARFYATNVIHASFIVETGPTARKMKPFTRFWRKLSSLLLLLEVVFFFIYLFIKIHNLSNLDIWWNFLTVKLACWWLPPAGYHPRVS